MRLTRLLVPFVLLVAFSACGGGGGGGTGGTAAIASPPPPTITGRFQVPNNGVANYSGFMNLNLPSGTGREVATGSLSLAIDFGAPSDQVSGTATGFSVLSSGTLTGQLFITDGDIRAEQGNDPPGFEAEISGTLKGGTLVNTLITGDVVADFDTTDVSAASGTVFGDVTTSQGIDIFDGSFSVGKQ